MKFKTPYVALQPPLATEEFEALRADIKAHGMRVPIDVDEDGAVLDGHNRLKICPKTENYNVVKGLSPAQKEAFVLRSNGVRRNLSPDQKREALARKKAVAFKLRQEDAKYWTQQRVADELGVARQTVSSWFTPNAKAGNRRSPSKQKTSKGPDAKVKLSPEAKKEAAARVIAGKTQEQVAADLGVVQQTISKVVAAERKKTEAEAARVALVESFKGTASVRHGDFREVLKDVADNSVALIFTDPPYDRKSLPLYEDLGKLAARVLVDGGSLVTYCGSVHTFEVMKLLSQQLRFFWVCSCHLTGRATEMVEYGIKVKWKPLLWFVKGKFRRDRGTWIDDEITSQQEKSDHAWQQAVVDASHFIDALSRPGELIVDPFCGSGTTAVAAKRAGLSFVTCDVDAAALKSAQVRLDDEKIRDAN